MHLENFEILSLNCLTCFFCLRKHALVVNECVDVIAYRHRLLLMFCPVMTHIYRQFSSLVLQKKDEMSGKARKLKVESLPSNITKRQLVKFFKKQVDKVEGLGSVVDAIICDDTSSAVIIFNDFNAVDQIIKRGNNLTIYNNEIKVFPYYDNNNRDCNPNQGKVANGFIWNLKSCENPEISELAITKNKKKSSHLESTKKKKEENYETLHSKSSSKSFEEENQNNSTVKVHFIGPCRKKDYYVIYLEDESLNIGAFYEESLMLDGLHNIFYITFHTPRDAENFCHLQHPPDTKITKVEMATEEDFRTHPNYIYLHGNLGNHIDLAQSITDQTGLYVIDIIQQNDPDSCIICFDSEECEDITPLTWELTFLGEKKMVTAPVYAKNIIIVSGLTTDISLSTLQRYLENNRRSGGGKVKDLKRVSDDQVIVYFEDDVDLENILSRQDHKIEDTYLNLSFYFPCLSKNYHSSNILRDVQSDLTVSPVLLKLTHGCLYSSEPSIEMEDGKYIGTLYLTHQIVCQFLKKYDKHLQDIVKQAHCSMKLLRGKIQLKLNWSAKIPLTESKRMLNNGFDKILIFLNQYVLVGFTMDEPERQEFQKFCLNKMSDIYFDQCSGDVIAISSESSKDLESLMHSLYSTYLQEYGDDRDMVYVTNENDSSESLETLDKADSSVPVKFIYSKDIHLKKPELILLQHSRFFEEIKKEKQIEFTVDLKECKVIIQVNVECQINEMMVKILEKCREDLMSHRLDDLTPDQMELLRNKKKQESINTMLQNSYLQCNDKEVVLFYLKSEQANYSSLLKTVKSHIKDQISLINASIDSFLETNKVMMKNVPFPKGKQEFLTKYLMKELKNFTSSLESDAEVQFNSNECVIKGIKENISCCEDFLKNMITKIQVNTLKVQFFGVQEYLQDTEGKNLLKNIEDENRCIIHVSPKVEKNFGLKVSDSLFLKQQIIGSAKLSSQKNRYDFKNIRVNLVLGEINQQNTDVIVISVSKSLDLSSGILAKSVLEKAGVVIQKELQEKYRKGIKFGEFAVSSGGNMACKYIFHACLSRYTGDNCEELANVITKILVHTEKVNATSVSIPALGAGNLAFPADVCCDAIMRGISSYAEKNVQSQLKHVNLVVFPKDVKIAQTFTTALSSGGADEDQHEDENDSEDDGSDKVPSKWVHTYGCVSLEIKQGDITKETNIDIIVNGVKNSMDLFQSGQVSNTLLKICGHELQNQCSALKDKMIQNGVVVTSAPNLSCKHIIHISQDQFTHNLDKGVSKVLLEAEKVGASSLALPSLGAGVPHANLKDIKKHLLTAVKEFGMSGQRRLTEIKLIIYDRKVVSVFLEKDVINAQFSQEKASDEIMLPISISEEAEVSIYSDDRNKRTLAEKNLLERCKKNFRVEKESDENLQRLDAKQVKELEIFGLQQGVKVVILAKDHILTIEGFRTEGMLQVHKKLKNLVVEASDRYHESLFKVVPSSIEWKFKKGDKWHKFEAMLNSEIEKEYQSQAPTHQIKDGKGHRYVLDFITMKKIVQDGTIQNKSFEIARFFTKGEPFSDCWDPMSETENVKIVEVKPGTAEYKKVEQHFTSKGANFAIKKIERIQNKSLYDQYCVKKKELELHNPKGHQNEQYLFHGTSAVPIQQINANGFNRSYCGINGTVYGNGVYFAVNSSYSVGFTVPDTQGNRHMYRARVLTGEFIATNSGNKYLPNKPGSNRPYDSGVNKAFQNSFQEFFFLYRKIYHKFGYVLIF
ncbi:hypothetical protein Btru_004354 [Bulinus truncatus]|nr:hypothetical protein Btru_004354 [Bulinus truncatus]